MNRPTLVLASASPARRRTLAAAGVDVTVMVSAVDEDAALAAAGVSAPHDMVGLLAQAKAQDVATTLGTQTSPVLVLGCDSMLELDGQMLGKPGSAVEAVQRWQAMRGRAGVLHTGHCLIDTSTGKQAQAVVSTTVHFADVSDAEIEAYVASGEPLAVAGAFTIDGLGAAFVTHIEGDHLNVIGVSVPTLRELTAELGVEWTSLWRSAPL